jgi:hypothetical protein
MIARNDYSSGKQNKNTCQVIPEATEDRKLLTLPCDNHGNVFNSMLQILMHTSEIVLELDRLFTKYRLSKNKDSLANCLYRLVNSSNSTMDRLKAHTTLLTYFEHSIFEKHLNADDYIFKAFLREVEGEINSALKSYPYYARTEATLGGLYQGLIEENLACGHFKDPAMLHLPFLMLFQNVYENIGAKGNFLEDVFVGSQCQTYQTNCCWQRSYLRRPPLYLGIKISPNVYQRSYSVKTTLRSFQDLERTLQLEYEFHSGVFRTDGERIVAVTRRKLNDKFYVFNEDSSFPIDDLDFLRFCYCPQILFYKLVKKESVTSFSTICSNNNTTLLKTSHNSYNTKCESIAPSPTTIYNTERETKENVAPFRMINVNANIVPSENTIPYPQTLLKFDNRTTNLYGLPNYGNTCFANAVLQILLHIEEFIDGLVEIEYSNPKQCPLLHKFVDLVSYMQLETEHREEIKSAHSSILHHLERFILALKQGKAGVSSEFFLTVLKVLEDETKGLQFQSKKGQKQIPNIRKAFLGETMTQTICHKCQNEDPTPGLLPYLSVTYKNFMNPTFENNLFTNNKTECSECNNKEVEQCAYLTEAPKYLVIWVEYGNNHTIKTYDSDAKLHKTIFLNKGQHLEKLDIAAYEFFGGIFDYSHDGIHDVAIVNVRDNFYKFNDMDVREASKLWETPKLLFYKSRD